MSWFNDVAHKRVRRFSWVLAICVFVFATAYGRLLADIQESALETITPAGVFGAAAFAFGLGWGCAIGIVIPLKQSRAYYGIGLLITSFMFLLVFTNMASHGIETEVSELAKSLPMAILLSILFGMFIVTASALGTKCLIAFIQAASTGRLFKTHRWDD